MKKNHKLMVTGGKGLVGSSISCDLRIGSEYDLRNSVECDNLFSRFKPTKVIHCAGKVGGLGGNMNMKGEFFYDNIMINTNVIESCRKYNVKKLVCFLSTCVFPDDVTYPLNIDQIHKGEPHNSNYPYAYAKRMADIQIKAYREQYGLNYTSIIPSNIYGPNDNFSLTQGHVMPMLIHKLFLAKQNKTSFTVWGTGKPLREFLFSKDIAKISKWVLENYEGTDPLIISGDEEVSIKDLVDILVQEFNFKGNVIFDNNKPDGQYRKPSNNNKIKELLPNFKYTSFEKGVKETVKWFIENYESCRK
jgi:GDP-L-fucose synthase